MRKTIFTINSKHLFMNIFCIESFCPQKMHNRMLFFGSIFLKHSHQPMNMRMRICYLRVTWSWTVLLPSDTHRKCITSITAVLLPFLTYLLTPSYYEEQKNLFLSPVAEHIFRSQMKEMAFNHGELLRTYWISSCRWLMTFCLGIAQNATTHQCKKLGCYKGLLARILWNDLRNGKWT
jgi:hypothetical protein